MPSTLDRRNLRWCQGECRPTVCSRSTTSLAGTGHGYALEIHTGSPGGTAWTTVSISRSSAGRTCPAPPVPGEAHARKGTPAQGHAVDHDHADADEHQRRRDDTT